MGFQKNFIFTILIFAFFLPSSTAATESPGSTVVQRIKASHAHQGVAVDKNFVYAISSKQIGRYDRRTGRLVDVWQPSADHNIIHLNSGVVVNGKLYAAHSNYPRIPMESSIEIWDVEKLHHIGTVPLGEGYGSCTWIDRYNGAWWVCYAHYAGFGGYFDKGPEWTTLVKYDDNFTELGKWTFPKEVVKRFSPFSSSGGSWGPDGLLYVSGHRHPELYVLQIPRRGTVLTLVRTIEIESNGQGIAWDREQKDMICSIKRNDREVVISRMTSPRKMLTAKKTSSELIPANSHKRRHPLAPRCDSFLPD
jgi:hypothetical protein